VSPRFQKDESGVYRAVSLLEIPWLEHGFGSRRSTAWNQQSDLASLNQIHSAVCLYAGDRQGRLGEGDALTTDIPGTPIAVRTADCVPVLLVDTRHRAVAAVHAGWRGTVQGIAALAVEAMTSRFGSSPRDLAAAIGPGIDGCCFEVGDEVAVQFRDIFPERDDLQGQTRLDLPEANRRQLIAAGLLPENVSIAGLCTCCSGDEFYSWRRELVRSGRMIAAIAVRKK
jgi:hypothetical protein